MCVGYPLGVCWVFTGCPLGVGPIGQKNIPVGFAMLLSFSFILSILEMIINELVLRN